MKVLVTGGAGFIGSHIVDAFRAAQADVICVDALDTGVHKAKPAYLRGDVDYVFEDLRSWQPGRNAEGVEIIVHLAALGGVARAAREPVNVIEGNVMGTARLAGFARGLKKLKRIILASSFSVYGKNYSYSCAGCGARRDGSRQEKNLKAGRYDVYCDKCGAVAAIEPITESARPAPLETYAASKFMQETCLTGFDAAPVSVLRFSSAYGSRLRLEDSEATIVAQLAGWIQSGRAPTLFEDGGQIRDFVCVKDIVAAVMALSAAGDSHPLTNVCSGVGTTLKEAADILNVVLHKNCAAEVRGGYRVGDMRHCLGDPTRLKNLIGRDPIPFASGAGCIFES